MSYCKDAQRLIAEAKPTDSFDEVNFHRVVQELKVLEEKFEAAVNALGLPLETLRQEYMREPRSLDEQDRQTLLRILCLESAIKRNRKCALAYIHSRSDMVRGLWWTHGRRLPEVRAEKLNEEEKLLFNTHSEALEAAQRELSNWLGMDLDLRTDLKPPKGPGVSVLVLESVGEILTASSGAITLEKGQVLRLRKEDVGPLVDAGRVKVV